MPEGLADDGSDPMEHVDMWASLQNLGKGEIDPSKVYRMPSATPDEYMMVSVRMPVRVVGMIEDRTGRGKKYRNRSKFIQHAILLAFDVDARDDGNKIDVRLEVERIKEEVGDITKTLKMTEELLDEAGGAPDREKRLLDLLRSLLRTCEEGGHADLKRRTINLLARYERFEDL